MKDALSAADVLLIREQYDAGTLIVKWWCERTGASAETIRRAARRETYRDVVEADRVPPHEAEPTEDDIMASLNKLQQTFNEAPMSGREADAIIEEIAHRKDNQDDHS